MNPFPVRKKQMAKKNAHRDLQKKQNIKSSSAVIHETNQRHWLRGASISRVV
jgi:hypothetical protein